MSDGRAFESEDAVGDVVHHRDGPVTQDRQQPVPQPPHQVPEKTVRRYRVVLMFGPAPP